MLLASLTHPPHTLLFTRLPKSSPNCPGERLPPPGLGNKSLGSNSSCAPQRRAAASKWRPQAGGGGGSSHRACRRPPGLALRRRQPPGPACPGGRLHRPRRCPAAGPAPRNLPDGASLRRPPRSPGDGAAPAPPSLPLSPAGPTCSAPLRRPPAGRAGPGQAGLQAQPPCSLARLPLPPQVWDPPSSLPGRCPPLAAPARGTPDPFRGSSVGASHGAG